MKENIDYKSIHMIGIGGVSMSGIAHILLNWGYTISGSDRNNSAMLDGLTKKGAKIFIGHSSENVTDQDLVIYTAAVPRASLCPACGLNWCCAFLPCLC